MDHLLRYISISFLGIALLMGCNEIPPEIPPVVPPGGDRNVLIEEFSGVQCPNCPVGAAQIENLRALYGDRIVAVTHHAYLTGVLSAPLPESQFDFRTEVSDEILNFLGLPTGIPSATIDRRLFEGENGLMLSPNQWAGKVETALSLDAPVGISLEVQFDSISRKLDVEVRVFAQEEVSGDLRYHMGLVESGMIDYQIDGNTIIDEYEHNHILRKYLTDGKGDNIANRLDLGEQWSRVYSDTLPQGDGWWRPENMFVFGFVTNIQNNSKTVLQAEEVDVIP